MEQDVIRVVNISRTSDDVVIHFETSGERINAYTLASALVGIADAAKAANADLNLGYDIEVVVEALGRGSFRAQLRGIYTKARNLFSDQRVQAIILNIVAAFIYERYLATKQEMRIEIHTTEVVIEHGQERVVIPREVYDATRKAERNPQFVRSVEKTLESIGKDDGVNGIGFIGDMNSPSPKVMIPHDFLKEVQFQTVEDVTRVIEESCDVQIVKAILERSTRKWEFMWRGVKISAPILSDDFYTRFFAQNITIAPGDELKVRLRIKQSRDPNVGVYTNIGYEVIDVFDHVPRVRQMPLDDSAAAGKE